MVKSLIKNKIFIISLIGLWLSRILGAMIITVYDDAFITFRYAENLVSGNGFVYHAGEWVMGVTTPLYSLIAALISLTGFDLPTAMVAFNIFVDGILLFFLFSIFEENQWHRTYPIFALLYSISPILTRTTVGAMEMNLFTLATIVSIYFYTKNRKYLAITIGTAAYFIRPESALLVILLIAIEFLSYNKMKYLAANCKIPIKGKGFSLQAACSKLRGIKPTIEGLLNSIKLALISISILIIPFLILYSYYGNFIPQSVLSKKNLPGNIYNIIKSFIFGDAVFVIIFILVLLGIYKAFRKNNFTKILSLWSLLFLATYLIMRPFVWSWYAHAFRLALVFFASFSAEYLFDYLQQRKHVFKPVSVAVVSAAIPVIIWFGVVMYLGGSSPIRTNVMNKLEVWCQNNDLANKTILANDIGIVGYYSKARIFDTQGLVSPKASEYKNLEEAIIGEMPDYIFLNILKNDFIVMDKLNDLYAPVEIFSKNGDTDYNLKTEDLNDIWQQSYVMFKRLR